MKLVEFHGLQIDEELTQGSNIFQKRGFPPPFLPSVTTIDQFRRRWSAGTARFNSSKPALRLLDDTSNCVETDVFIPVRDGAKIRARTYQPDGLKSLPLLVLFHGGGFCMGGLDTEEFICRLLSSKLGIVVLNIDYRLAPESPFPVGVHDAIDATWWASQNSERLDADPRKGFLIGGISGGATYAAIIAQIWQEKRLTPPITGTLQAIPILDDQVKMGDDDIKLFPAEYTSHEENAGAPLLNAEMSKVFWDLYKPDRTSVLHTPFLFKSHADLPRTYFQVCSLDPFRDGALIYERLLREAGSETRLDKYEGLPHGFWAAFPSLTATGQWVADTIAGTAWLLQHELSNGKSNAKL